MGGVSVLLMVAAIGITYGWHPDDKGGVEYVIQIEPDQLDALDRIGEISSVIDPAVRGHVSRVIIKVGTDPVPKITPPNLAKRGANSSSDGMVVADHAPIPIPEMENSPHAIPIPSPGQSGIPAGRTTAVMKPDTGDAQSGPGFTFPSLPSSLRDSAASGQNRDAAIRAVVPPPGTRSPSRTQAPQFTGGDPSGQMAQARPGGPSTNPTNSRDNSWRNFATTNEFVGPRSGGPSTDPISGSGASIVGKSSGVNPGFGGTGVSGLSASDSFGRMPDGLQTATRDPQAQERNLYAEQGNLRSANVGARGVDPNAVYSQYEQTQLDRQAEYARAVAEAARARSNVPGALPDNSQLQYNQQIQGNTLSGQSPDTRLTAAQVAAGAWTVDGYGRPVDRNGRLLALNTTNQNLVDSDRGQINRYADRSLSSLGQPNVTTRGEQDAQTTNSNTLRFPGVSTPSRSQSTVGGQAFPNPGGQQWATQLNDPNQSFVRESDVSERGGFRGPTQRGPQGTVAVQRQPDPPSLTTTRGNDSTLAAAPRVTTQPLLNGLLLISFVANVYLIFWMKNLRMQFRDLVAAKRIASSNSHPA